MPWHYHPGKDHNIITTLYCIVCSFEHKHFRVENNIAKVIENNSKQCDEDIEKTDEEKSFDLYVKTNFPEVYDYYLTNQKHIPCYFCDYISKKPSPQKY